MTTNLENVTLTPLSEKELFAMEMINKHNLSKDIGDAMDTDGVSSEDGMVRYNIDVPENLIKEYEDKFGSSEDFGDVVGTALNKVLDFYLNLPTE